MTRDERLESFEGERQRQRQFIKIKKEIAKKRKEEEIILGKLEAVFQPRRCDLKWIIKAGIVKKRLQFNL